MRVVEAIIAAREAEKQARAEAATVQASRPAGDPQQDWAEYQRYVAASAAADDKVTRAHAALIALEQQCYEPSDSDTDSLRAIQNRILGVNNKIGPLEAKLATAEKKGQGNAAEKHRAELAPLRMELAELKAERDRLADRVGEDGQ